METIPSTGIRVYIEHTERHEAERDERDITQTWEWDRRGLGDKTDRGDDGDDRTGMENGYTRDLETRECNTHANGIETGDETGWGWG